MTISTTPPNDTESTIHTLEMTPERRRRMETVAVLISMLLTRALSSPDEALIVLHTLIDGIHSIYDIESSSVVSTNVPPSPQGSA